jgi:hypothetical protein
MSGQGVRNERADNSGALPRPSTFEASFPLHPAMVLSTELRAEYSYWENSAVMPFSDNHGQLLREGEIADSSATS